MVVSYIVNSTLGLLRRTPEAGSEAVADLVEYALQGRIRVPEFQRSLKWQEREVVNLFDSIYRGLPVGSLLFWKRAAEADPVRLGPLRIDAPQFRDAWWVVDGQQRLTTLAACLARPLPLPARATRTDPFVVYFDAQTGAFVAPANEGPIEEAWVPLPAMLDATRLSEWVHEWSLGGDRDLRKRVFEAGSRIREYKLPRYLVEAPDDETGRDLLREIFFRVNNSGRALEWNEVHDALYGQKGEAPSTTKELSDELALLGMGRPDESLIINCLLAFRGLDVTRPLAEHRRRDPHVLRGAASEALPVLKQALTFLRGRAFIPHLRMLPRTMLLEVLARFFALHPEPNRRTLDLLSRWVWRALVAKYAMDERTLERRALAAVHADEELSIQKMLDLLPRQPTEHVLLPESFDARTAESRVALLGLAFLGPKNLQDGTRFDIAQLVEAHGVDAFVPVIRNSPRQSAGESGPENRLLHAPVHRLVEIVVARAGNKDRDAVLRTHAITPEAVRALRDGDEVEFLALRRKALQLALQKMATDLTGYGRRDNDRPSIAHLLKRAAAGR